MKVYIQTYNLKNALQVISMSIIGVTDYIHLVEIVMTYTLKKDEKKKKNTKKKKKKKIVKKKT